MEIVNFTSVKDKKSYIKALIYGQAGSGKTRFAADAPKPFWFDFESSTETLRHWPDYTHIPVKVSRDVYELFDDVKKAIKDPEIETVVIDTITSGLDYFMRKEAQKRAQKRDEFVFHEADYKYATQVFTKLFGTLQEAPINVVLIGHERVIRDIDTGNITGIFPDVTPRLQQAVTRLVNVVAYMEEIPSSKGNERKIYLKRTKTIEAKNRLNIQETFIVDPNWKDVFDV